MQKLGRQVIATTSFIARSSRQVFLKLPRPSHLYLASYKSLTLLFVKYTYRGATTSTWLVNNRRTFTTTSISKLNSTPIVNESKKQIKLIKVETMAGKIDGASLVVKSLKEQGVEYIFGVVGIPIVEVAIRAQQYGIKYIGMRNEQSVNVTVP